MRGKFLTAFTLIVTVPFVSEASGLSQNSGINISDSHVTFNLSLQSNSNLTLSQPVYNASTNTMASSIALNGSVNYRVEAGYDADGQLVMNVFSLDPVTDPAGTVTDGVLLFRLAKGKLVVFDQDGKPLPMVIPDGAPVPDPLQFLGSNPGSSVVNGMVVSDMQAYANEKGATLQYSQAAPGSTAPSTVQMSAAVTASGGGSTTWTYQAQGNEWILKTISVYSGTDTTQTSYTAQITSLIWYRSASSDAYRASQGSTAQPPPNGPSQGPQMQPLTEPSQSASTVEPGCLASGTGQNIVFQHGLLSGCGTWTQRMFPWLKAKYQFGTVLIPSLSSLNRLDSQGSDLVNLVASSGHNNFMVIGHSQGGLIARDGAQRRPDLFGRGVMTLNTPHHGAQFALTSRVVAAVALGDRINFLGNVACSHPIGSPACFLAFFLEDVRRAVAVNYAFDTAIPASTDLIPGSQYVQRLNSVPETFTRVGIEGHVTRRWSLMRVGGDFFFFPEARFGGRNMANFTSITYASFRTCQILAWIFGFPSLGAFCGNVANGMDIVDLFWNFVLVAPPGQGSDGIVQNSSQIYPAATARYVVTRADSHVGSTKSDKTRTALERALEQNFGVVRLGCTHSITPAGASFSAQGGAGSLSVSTVAGCSWSAVPSDGWVALTAGTTGSGSGTVSFSVDANFSPMPRSATITVGTRTFTISQAGASGCIFVLSPSSFTFPSDGGDGSVSVTTQPGCIWSATASTSPIHGSWINISSGATGTGSGSVHFWVGVHTGSTPRTGSISVMGQSSTVTQDTPYAGCKTRVCQ